MSGTAVRSGGAARGTIAHALEASWRQRELLGYFARRFNEKRYLRTFLGAWWLLLRPGMTVAWQVFAFLVVASIDGGPGSTPFLITFLIGFATWSFFSEGAFWTTRSLELNRRVLKLVPVSPLVILVAALVPALVDLAICAGFVLIALLAYLAVDGTWYVDVSPELLWVVPGFAALTAFALGVGLALAVPGARFRDVRFLLRFALGIWYFVTPVVYPITMVPEGVRTLVELNPLTGAVALVRHGLLDTPFPDALPLAATVVGSALMLAVGLWRFTRGHAKALDHL